MAFQGDQGSPLFLAGPRALDPWTDLEAVLPLGHGRAKSVHVHRESKTLPLPSPTSLNLALLLYPTPSLQVQKSRRACPRGLFPQWNQDPHHPFLNEAQVTHRGRGATEIVQPPPGTLLGAWWGACLQGR